MLSSSGAEVHDIALSPLQAVLLDERQTDRFLVVVLVLCAERPTWSDLFRYSQMGGSVSCH